MIFDVNESVADDPREAPFDVCLEDDAQAAKKGPILPVEPSPFYPWRMPKEGRKYREFHLFRAGRTYALLASEISTL